MINPEEYNKKNGDEVELEKLPTTAVVIIIVLSSIVGFFIVSETLWGL